MFIELHEYYYRNGTYLTRSLIINKNEISSVFEINEYSYDAVRVCLNGGRYHDVKETYNEIVEKIMK